MPVETATRPRTGLRSPTLPRGWVVFHPSRGATLWDAGYRTPDALLDLPGEVVSGHADRHVREVRLGGAVLFLKRQHRVTWRERLRQRLAGFGWASRCAREAAVLRQLERDGFACPNWVAYGEDGRGRAFLVVERLDGFTDLRRILADDGLSLAERRQLVKRAGHAVAELHAAGYDTPDLTAKHVFVNPDTGSVALIDWPSARRGRVRAAAALAALHASLPDTSADPALRLRFLWAYLRTGRPHCRLSAVAREVDGLASRVAGKRSIRDQRQPIAPGRQRLVWLAGEAVCAVPAVAATWPTPADAPPFYPEPTAGWAEHTASVRLADGRTGMLVRFRTSAPLGRFVARLRGRPWRSPGTTLGRMLFHLDRYGIPAPRLFAFGQKVTGFATADSFTVYEPPTGEPLADWLALIRPEWERRLVLGRVGAIVRRLRDAGCALTRPAETAFHVEATGRVVLADVRAVRLTRRS